MKVLSRNVNGIRSVITKGFAETIKRLDPDIIALQEPKAFFAQCPEEVKMLDYEVCWHAGTRPGYAGTVLMSKKQAHANCNTFEHTMFHEDGRVTEISFDDTIILSVYFPNGGTRADGTEMLTYKLKFYDSLMLYLATKKDKNIVVIGDFNIVHEEIDIARPKENANSIGFLPVEREKFSEFLNQGFTDSFRYLHPDARDEYTWWSYRSGAKKNNVGRRIDYACVSNNIRDKIISCTHFPDISGSDHCPIMLEIDLPF